MKGQNMKNNAGSRGGRSMTQSAAARIHSATARANGGQVSSGSFPARAQAAAAHNASKGGTGGGGTKAGN